MIITANQTHDFSTRSTFGETAMAAAKAKAKVF